MEHNITIASSTGVPEWAKRLKSNESPHLIHRSTDCIAKELTKHGLLGIGEAALKNAPSWTALATTGPSHSGHAHPPSSASSSGQSPPAPQHQQQWHSQKSHHLLNLLHKDSNTPSSSKSSADSAGTSHSSTVGTSAVAAATTAASPVAVLHHGEKPHKGSIDAGKTSNGSDDEAAAAAAAVKAAEAAAKKSRIKQSLVKRARSVAIFSLKLKERRQREAEKAAQAAIEHAKVGFTVSGLVPILS